MRPTCGQNCRSWAAVSACLMAVPGLVASAATGVSPEPARFVSASSVGEEFQQQVQSAAESVPAEIWRRLQQSGWQFRTAEFVVDAVPALRGQSPRGWPEGMTWENTDAVHMPKSRLLVFAEKRRTTKGEVVFSSRVSGVVRHELGHAVDMALADHARFRSSERDFLAAYHRDIQELSAAQRADMDYYLQNGAAGRQETFAEAFAILLGGGSDTDKRSIFEESFPRVTDCVHTLLTP